MQLPMLVCATILAQPYTWGADVCVFNRKPSSGVVCIPRYGCASATAMCRGLEFPLCVRLHKHDMINYLTMARSISKDQRLKLS